MSARCRAGSGGCHAATPATTPSPAPAPMPAPACTPAPTGTFPASRARRAARPGSIRAAAGFTLIEVVVAVAVVALGLAAAFNSITRTAAFTTRLQERTLATWIAQNRIVELRLQPVVPEVGRSDGDVEFAGQDWVWNAEVIATQVESLRRVEVEVRHDEDGPVVGTAIGFVSTLPQAGLPRPWSGAPAGPGGLDGQPSPGNTRAPPRRGLLPGQAPPDNRR